MIDLTSVGPESQLQLDLEERLQFATLVANLSARFINLPADKVDTQIEEGLREICEYFVSAKRTASCERLSDVAMLRHDATYEADMDEVAEADPGARA